MSEEFQDLRAIARDRQKKTGAAGIYTHTLPLKPELVEELEELEAQRPEAPRRQSGKRRLSDAPPETEAPVDEDLEQLIGELKTKISKTLLTIKFRSLSSKDYQAVSNKHPDVYWWDENGLRHVHDDRWILFCNELCQESMFEVIDATGTTWDSTWEQLCAETINEGEWEAITAQVSMLNRKVVTVPKSLKPSATGQ
jgi:hypothetical protein